MKGTLHLGTRLAHGGTAAARLVDGRLEDLLVDPPPGSVDARPGAIHLAVPGRAMKNLGGVFVDLGEGARGFLRDVRGISPGRPLLVQVSAWGETGKAAPVTRRVLLKGRFAILTPGAPGLNLSRSISPGSRPRLEALAREAMVGAPEELGLILRSSATEAEDAAILAEAAALRADWATLAEAGGPPACLRPAPSAIEEARRDWPDPGAGNLLEGADAFATHGVWEEIEALLRPEVPLATGGRLHVEPTRALVAVDVDTGNDTSPAAGLKANLAAARELPRQLRLRGLGGQVVVDPAPLARAERARMTDALKAALARDGIETTVAGWSSLGLLELQRKRTRRPLAELLPRP